MVKLHTTHMKHAKYYLCLIFLSLYFLKFQSSSTKPPESLVKSAEECPSPLCSLSGGGGGVRRPERPWVPGHWAIVRSVLFPFPNGAALVGAACCCADDGL